MGTATTGMEVVDAKLEYHDGLLNWLRHNSARIGNNLRFVADGAVEEAEEARQRMPPVPTKPPVIQQWEEKYGR